MKQLIITTQREWDEIPNDFEGIIYVTGKLTEINSTPLRAQVCICGSAKVEEIRGLAKVEAIYGSAEVNWICDSAEVKRISSSAKVKEIYGSANVKEISGSANVKEIFGSAKVERICGLAEVELISGSAEVNWICDSAEVREIYGSAEVNRICGSVKIGQLGENCMIFNISSTEAKILKATKSVLLRHSADFVIEKENKAQLAKIVSFQAEPTLKTYFEKYPKEESENGKLIFYKAVRKRDGRYFSNWDGNFEYKIGQVRKEKIDQSKEKSCAVGLHVSHLIWAKRFSEGWSNCAILCCEVDRRDIVVSRDCDGKIRTSRLRILGEVNFGKN